MKRPLVFFVLVALALAGFGGLSAARADTIENQGLLPAGQVQTDTGRIIVKFGAGVPANERAQLHANFNAAVIGEIPALSMQVVSIQNPRATQAIAAAYDRHPLVVFAEPDALVPLAHTTGQVVTPNDTHFGLQWHHANIGSTAVWHHTTGNSGLRITICDTGVNANHADLAPNMNTALGWNAVDGSNDFWPIHYHGTTVAGAAAALGNNALGVAGVAWQAEIIPVRISNLSGGGAYFSDMVKCIDYGATHNSVVINLSYQTYSGNGALRSLSQAIIDAGNAAYDKGSLLVVAAGNENTNPSGGLDPAKLLYVAATDSADKKASFSNYGAYVDIAAPGVDIVTTYSTCSTSSCSQYVYIGGTSFSAPITAGAALLVKAANPGYGPGQILAALTSCAKNIGSSTNFGAGLLQAHGSAHGTTCSGGSSPPAPTLSSISVSPSEATIDAGATQAFTATGTFNDGSTQSPLSGVTWTSSTASAATINSSGVATGQPAGGQTTITASKDGKSATATLNVNPAPVTLQSITISPSSASIDVGGTRQFTATANYSNGTTSDLTSSATWTSSNAGVATIDGAGLASGLAAGSTNIRASFQGVNSNQATLTVNSVAAPVPGPTISNVDPPSGSPRQSLNVTITGSGFQNGASVDFGERVVVQSVTVVSDTQISVGIRVHPQAQSGARNVTVTNPDGQSAIAPNAFTVN